jgi:hypothetical protein
MQPMGDLYITGLRAAETALWARSMRHTAERSRYAHDPMAASECLVEALEAAECAAEIQRLIVARAPAKGD